MNSFKNSFWKITWRYDSGWHNQNSIQCAKKNIDSEYSLSVTYWCESLTTFNPTAATKCDSNESSGRICFLGRELLLFASFPHSSSISYILCHRQRSGLLTKDARKEHKRWWSAHDSWERRDHVQDHKITISTQRCWMARVSATN